MYPYRLSFCFILFTVLVKILGASRYAKEGSPLGLPSIQHRLLLQRHRHCDSDTVAAFLEDFLGKLLT